MKDIDFNEMNRSFESSDEIDHAIYEFNHMLKTGTSGNEAYSWLAKREHEISEKYNQDFSFRFLYPEFIGPIPDTYEEWKQMLFEQYNPKYCHKVELTEYFKEQAVKQLGQEKAEKLIKKLENIL